MNDHVNQVAEIGEDMVGMIRGCIESMKCGKKLLHAYHFSSFFFCEKLASFKKVDKNVF